MVKKKRARLTALWTVAGTLAVAFVAKTASRPSPERRAEMAAEAAFKAEADLRDAVGSPVVPATAALAGRPVPTAWFKTPDQRKVEMNSALLSSRRKRLARRVAVQ